MDDLVLPMRPLSFVKRAQWNVVAFTAASLVFAYTVPALAQTPPIGPYTAGREFNLSSNFVSTAVFHWFTSTGGQLSGPWQPLGGRASWTGTPLFWQGQIKQMMDANIDVINVHLIPSMEQQRINLFQALHDLRAQGYDVPKVVPFLDPVITGAYGWNGVPNASIDLATPAGKDAFVNQYIRFYRQYYSVNPDPYADSYIAQMNGAPILDTWHTFLTTTNSGSLTRQDVQGRLAAALGAAHPMFTHGIYMETTALNPPILSFADEKIPQFEITSYYAYQANANGRNTVQLKGGYWDQNIRNPGSFLPRDGGVHYADAWNQVLQNAAGSHIKQVYVESWNEYDEGSGIYAASTGPPHLQNGNPNTDTWSRTNNPFEYIDTTAAGARQFNDTPDRDARILWNDFPRVMWPGQTLTAHVLVRNEGDLKWTEAQHFRFGEVEFKDPMLFGPTRYYLNDNSNEIPTYGGIFRGRPVMFDVPLTAPRTPGTYATHWGMLQELVTWFGQELDLPITVTIPGDANLDGRVDFSDLVLLAHNYGHPGAWTDGDFNGDGSVDFADLVILARNYGQSAPARVQTAISLPEPAAVLALAGVAALVRLRPQSHLEQNRTGTQLVLN